MNRQRLRHPIFISTAKSQPKKPSRLELNDQQIPFTRTQNSMMSNNFMMTKKIQLKPKTAKLTAKAAAKTEYYEEECCEAKVISNFDRLKNQIKQLQNSQFLSFKGNLKESEEEMQEMNNSPFVNSSTFVNNSQFSSLKKQALYEKYKLSLKQKRKSRKLSSILNNYPPTEEDLLPLTSIKLNEPKPTKSTNHLELSLKKKETPNIVKKFYRPQSCINRTFDKIDGNKNQVRGKRVNSRAEGEKSRDKENLFIVFC